MISVDFWREPVTLMIALKQASNSLVNEHEIGGYRECANPVVGITASQWIPAAPCSRTSDLSACRF
jgi:hypothetical protein